MAIDQSVLDSIKVISHASETDLARALDADGQTGDEPLPKRLFRGQVDRQPPRHWPAKDHPLVKKHAFRMEKLLPTDYRKLEEVIEAVGARTRTYADLDRAYGDRIAAVRSRMTEFLMTRHSKWADASVQQWYGSIKGSDRANKLLSVGQHYGLPTHFTDLSSKWRASLWFASHRWSGGYVAGGWGVVYEFDVAAVEAAATEANRIFNKNRQIADCALIDIRDTPQILAPRASSQGGFSLISLESPLFLNELLRRNGLTVHLFERGAAESAVNAVQHAQLVPPNDEMADLFKETASPKASLFSDAVTWINARDPILLVSDQDKPLIFA